MVGARAVLLFAATKLPFSNGSFFFYFFFFFFFLLYLFHSHSLVL